MKVRFSLRELEMLNQLTDLSKPRPSQNPVLADLQHKLPQMITARRDRKAEKAARKAGA